MPDSGIMLELCELLKINVNELLSGERIMAEAYDKRAEENRSSLLIGFSGEEPFYASISIVMPDLNSTVKWSARR
jgi:hypothetical protein